VAYFWLFYSILIYIFIAFAKAYYLQDYILQDNGSNWFIWFKHLKADRLYL